MKIKHETAMYKINAGIELGALTVLTGDNMGEEDIYLCLAQEIEGNKFSFNKQRYDYQLALEGMQQELHQIVKDKPVSTYTATIEQLLTSLIGGTISLSERYGYFIYMYHPSIGESVHSDIPLGDAPSFVYSLSELYIYCKYLAKKGDIIFIEEPELGLCFNKQRQIAKLISALVNVGINVVVLTRSYTIIHEFSTQLMLSADKPHIKELLQIYNEDCVLNHEKVKVYATVREGGNITLDSQPVDDIGGILIYSLDIGLSRVNELVDSIIWGGK